MRSREIALSIPTVNYYDVQCICYKKIVFFLVQKLNERHFSAIMMLCLADSVPNAHSQEHFYV